MLPRSDIIAAVEIQNRSYKLLHWLSEAVERGLISSHTVEDYTSIGEAAFLWLEDSYGVIPEDLRPERDYLRSFSNYFGSYLVTSFDIVHDPGTRLDESMDWDVRIINLPHLQPRKPTKRDKVRAREACVARVMMLSHEEGFQITRPRAESVMAADPRSAAYSAYAFSILERIQGWEGDPHILALWRMIAWTPEGSPTKGFSLEAEDIFDAEHELVTAIIACVRNANFS